MERLAPLSFYQEHNNKRDIEKKELTTQKNRIAWARVVALLAGALLMYTFWPLSLGLALLIIAVFGGSFLYLVSRTIDLQQQIALLEKEMAICKEEEAIVAHRFMERFNGAAFSPKDHPYANDLDIFGQASLYQYLQRCSTEPGQTNFASWLLAPATDETILQRQAAAKEISSIPDWSIRLQAIGLIEPLQAETARTLSNWLKEKPVFTESFWKWVAIIFPIISLASLVVYIFDGLSAPAFYGLIAFYLLIAFSITRRVMPAYKSLDKVVPQLTTLNQVLKHIETTSFQSPALKNLQQRLSDKSPAASTASHSILSLRKILDRFDYRLNPIVFLPLNAFLLWDLQQILQLEKWRSRQQENLPDWFAVIGAAEALNSIGRAAFNHPDWNFPTPTDKPATFEADELSHPLIPEAKSIPNSYATSGRPAITLITGSNMAGKSTFLRSIGTNQVLAMCGAPVAARALTVSNMRIMSSMRIADNLEENTSTFYAELSKLKSIIEAVNRKEPVFLLLDEILRGTNSQDRQTGSRALIQQLIRENGAGLLATHDLSLTDLEQQFPGVLRNFHFDVSVEGEELYFDYKLKTGICQSMNASILMKKIGIDL